MNNGSLNKGDIVKVGNYAIFHVEGKATLEYIGEDQAVRNTAGMNTPYERARANAISQIREKSANVVFIDGDVDPESKRPTAQLPAIEIPSNTVVDGPPPIPAPQQPPIPRVGNQLP